MKNKVIITILALFLIANVMAISSWDRNSVYPLNISIDYPLNDTLLGVSDIDFNWTYGANQYPDVCSFSVDGGSQNYSIYDKNWTGMNQNYFTVTYYADTGGSTAPESFYMDGVYYAVVENGQLNTGASYGTTTEITGFFYNETASAWQTYPAMSMDISDDYTYASMEVFFYNDELYGIVAVPPKIANWTGFSWNGTGWQSNSSILAGLNLSSTATTLTIYEMNDTFYLWDNSGTIYSWDGSQWNYFSTGIAGHSFEVIERFGNYYALMGNFPENDGDDVLGYIWNGSSFVRYPAIDEINVQAFTFPSVSFFKGNFYYVIGQQQGKNVGYNETFTTSKSNDILSGLGTGTHYVTLTCDDYSVSSYFEVDVTNPYVEYSDGTPADDVSLYSASSFLVNVSVDEPHEDTIVFSLYDVNDNPLSVNLFTDGTRDVIFSNLTDGTYKYSVYVNDTLGYYLETPTRTIHIYNNPQDYYPLFSGEITYTGSDRNVYSILRSSGAGLGKLFEYLSLSLPVLIIGIAMIGIILLIGLGIAQVIKNQVKGRGR